MPRIPTYESGASLPSSIGAYHDNSAGEAIANAGASFGQSLMRFAQQKEEREQKTAILAAKNEFRQRSLEDYTKIQQERQGQAALPDENTGYKGVYKTYNEEALKWSDELLTKHGVNKRYRDAAMEQLDGVANAYRDNYAAWESTQSQVWRKETLQGTQDVTEKQLSADLQAGGGPDDIAASIASMDEQIDFLVGPTGNAEGVKNAKRVAAAQITKTALATLVKSDPVRAKELLTDEKVQEYLDPMDHATLTEIAEKERIPFEADREVDRIEASATTQAAQLELAQKIEDDDVRDAVISSLSHKHAVQDKIDNENQFNTLEKYYSRIFVNKENVSLSSIDKDPVLDPSQKLAVKSWMKKAVGGDGTGGGGEETKKQQRLNQWFSAYQKVLSGDWQEIDLMRAANTAQLDPSDAKSLMGEVEKVREVPSLGKAVETLEGELKNIFKDKEDKAQYMKTLYQDVLEFRGVNKRNPSYNEMVKMGRELAKPDVERVNDSHWYNPGSWFPEYTQGGRAAVKADKEATTDRYKRETRQPYIQREVSKIRQAGEWPNAVWDEEQNVFYLGKRGGYHYYMTVDGQKMREKVR